MKKLYFTLFTFFVGLGLTNAQVLLQQTNHAPANGDTYVAYQIDSLLVAPGPFGASVVWNFTATPTRTTIPLNINCTASTNTLYPVGSVARATGTAAANYYTSNANQLDFWGGNFQALSFSVDYFFNSAAIHAVYPMAYNTTTTSSFTGTLKAGTTNGTISGGTSTVIADGQGTLNLPNRSFSNALRVSTFTGFNYNVPTLFASGSVKQQTWDYYSSLTNYPSTKIAPLFQIITNTIIVNATIPTPTTIVNTSTLVLLNRDYEYVGITENSSEVSELNLFPNPATNNFSLVFINENAQQVSVEISNALGQLVRKENLANTKGLVNQSVNIAGIEAGVYFVKVNVGAKSSIKKLTIQ